MVFHSLPGWRMITLSLKAHITYIKFQQLIFDWNFKNIQHFSPCSSHKYTFSTIINAPGTKDCRHIRDFALSSHNYAPQYANFFTFTRDKVERTGCLASRCIFFSTLFFFFDIPVFFATFAGEQVWLKHHEAAPLWLSCIFHTAVSDQRRNAFRFQLTLTY